MAIRSIEQARLLGLIISLVFFGMYTSLFFFLLGTAPRTRGFRRTFIKTVMWALWVLTLLNMIFSTMDIYIAFLKHPEGPHDYFIKRHWPVWGIIADFVMLLASTIADCFICWRLYVIWNHNKYVLIAPVCILAVGLGCGSLACVMEVLESRTSSPAYKNQVFLWARVSFCSTVLLNLLATTLICSKIWKISRSASGMTRRMNTIYVALVRASIESGSIFTITILTWVILTSSKLLASYLVAYMLPIAIGVAPTLCVLKIQLLSENSSVNDRPTTQTTPVVPFTEPRWHQGYTTNQLSTITFALDSNKSSRMSSDLEGGQCSTSSKCPMQLLTAEQGRRLSISTISFEVGSVDVTRV